MMQDVSFAWVYGNAQKRATYEGLPSVIYWNKATRTFAYVHPDIWYNTCVYLSECHPLLLIQVDGPPVFPPDKR